MVIIEDGQLLEPLRQLPVAALGIEADDVAALAELGVERIGELLQLDRAALADRFGHAIGRRLDQAMGAMPEVLDGVHPTEPIHAEQRFDGPVRQYEAIEQTARRLLKELADQLAQRESGARRLVLRFGQVDRHISQVVVQLSRPGRDMKHLWRLMSLRLETLRLTDAVEWISLRAESVGRIVHQQRGTTWWEAEQTQRSGGLQAIAQWLDVARHRLGTGRVVRAEPIAGYIPERAYRWQPARIDSPARQHRHPGQPVTVDEDRPSVLWHPPRPIEVMALSPGGPPVRLQWERQWKDIICSIGPRRIAGPWWEEPEGNSWIRDYYRAQDAGGQWWWLYRQAETGSWFAHGQWA
jgi:protein ImuB